MEVAGSSEIFVIIHHTVWRHIPEDININSHCYDNLKFHDAVASSTSEDFIAAMLVL
jgi:hypothetical protein